MGINAKQFEQMAKRVRGDASAEVDVEPSVPRPPHEYILGVDPSLRGTGFGVIRHGKGRAELLDQGTVRCPATWRVSRCLASIHAVLREVILRHHPTVCAVEGLFYAQNYRTALVMGEARGAAMVAAAGVGLEIYEIAPRKVKQAIVGYGNAQKIAVAKMVQRMLDLSEIPEADAADALALALAFSQENRRRIGVMPKQI
ncbi:crossover junction endodeoxyribonuclease RuvC [Verrucomicrobia bacterium]|jgi:crossover junction endodeoxyribonuclease RuvC|nr:crossover junction endodeoxyribonuclease RuvC [Verrucomicrobiota bacterium]MDG1889744.1 crossover junction endodeoxyribonuclease RuvC [Verrucomicrobiota bacterium]